MKTNSKKSEQLDSKRSKVTKSPKSKEDRDDWFLPRLEADEPFGDRLI